MLIDETKAEQPQTKADFARSDSYVAQALPPPAYPGQGTASAVPPLPAHNQLHIERNRDKISEIVLIDPSLPGGSGKNLNLKAVWGAISADVYLVGVVKERERVEMEATSDRGAITFAVRHRDASLPIHLIASSQWGTVSVALPPSFRGLLKVTTKRGHMEVHPNLAPRLRTLTDISGERTCWIGEGWPDGEEEWKRDECELFSMAGNVKVGFWEDKPPEEKRNALKKKRKLFN